MVDFKDLNLERKLSNKSFDLNGYEIHVLQYLPIDEKEDLVEATLNKSLVDGVYNPILLDKYLNLNILYCYTDIDFSGARADESDLYDILETNSIIDKVIELMNPDEYKFLLTELNTYKTDICKYRTSINGIIRAAIDDLPENVQKAVDILKSINPDQFKEILSIADTLKTLDGSGNK